MFNEITQSFVSKCHNLKIVEKLTKQNADLREEDKAENIQEQADTSRVETLIKTHKKEPPKRSHLAEERANIEMKLKLDGWTMSKWHDFANS